MPFLPKRGGGGGNGGQTSFTGAAVIIVGEFNVGTDAMTGVSVGCACCTGAAVVEMGASLAPTRKGAMTVVGERTMMGAAEGVGGGAMGGLGLVDRSDCHHVRNDLNSEPRKRGDRLALSAVVVRTIVVPLFIFNDGVISASEFT
jgi:hypothetical protein